MELDILRSNRYDEYDKYFEFIADEVTQMLEYYGVSDKEAELKDGLTILADEAPYQINQKRYDADMKTLKIKHILKFGIAFSEKTYA